MFAGIDYGTSNSALGIIEAKQVKLLPLYQDEKYLPSTLYTYDRSLICEYIHRNIEGAKQQLFQNKRLKQLQSAAAFRRHEGLDVNQLCNFFGKQAIQNYIDHPEDGVFIKSPKSFLGSTGLSHSQLQFFEDLVSAMLLNIKLIAEKQTQQALTQVVIGRPVNFQGVNSQKSNQQAIEIMTNAAKQCGFKEIEFLYEPLAAGVDFETSLTVDKIVLVVDIGGGTTDCSMVKMGPSFVNKQDRTKDFLAHTGQRVGGNDLDILLSYQCLMPLFGRGSLQKNGIELPDFLFWNAVSINNVAEQNHFSSQDYSRELSRFQRDAVNPELLERLVCLQKTKQQHRLVRSAELAKIDLAEIDLVSVDLNYIEDNLVKIIERNLFEKAIERPLIKIKNLVKEAIDLAAVKPDLVYITGGTAKSPTVRSAVAEIVPDTAILDGDYYGSVTAGLTKWAQKIWY